MNNMELYDKYRAVPQKALKPFDNGKFKGTDINTMWRIKSLTEEFGPCGVGWYFTTKRLWVEETKNGEQFAFADIELFIKYNGEWSKPISGNGGNKLLKIKKDGEPSTSDEAYKMAVTDALGVACRNLGFGADVYWDNDKTKYTEYATKSERKKATPIRQTLPEESTTEKLPWDYELPAEIEEDIWETAKRAGLTEEQVILGITLRYKKQNVSELTVDEANDCLRRFEDKIKERK